MHSGTAKIYAYLANTCTFMYTFSVPIKRGRQATIGGVHGYIGMGGHFEEFGLQL